MRPCFSAIISSIFVQLAWNFGRRYFSSSANFCQYGLLTKYQNLEHLSLARNVNQFLHPDRGSLATAPDWIGALANHVTPCSTWLRPPAVTAMGLCRFSRCQHRGEVAAGPHNGDKLSWQRYFGTKAKKLSVRGHLVSSSPYFGI